MSDPSSPQSLPLGVVVTARDIYDKVVLVESAVAGLPKLQQEVAELEKVVGHLRTQVAAQWVVHGLLVTVLIAQFAKVSQ